MMMEAVWGEVESTWGVVPLGEEEEDGSVDVPPLFSSPTQPPLSMKTPPRTHSTQYTFNNNSSMVINLKI
jgi:hypothetical protein